MTIAYQKQLFLANQKWLSFLEVYAKCLLFIKNIHVMANQKLLSLLDIYEDVKKKDRTLQMVHKSP